MTTTPQPPAEPCPVTVMGGGLIGASWCARFLALDPGTPRLTVAPRLDDAAGRTGAGPQ